LVLRIEILNQYSHSTIKIVTNAFKENKIRNKGIDILAEKSNTCCYCKSENISVKFLESISALRHSVCWVPKKEKRYYLIKTQINMAHVYRILEGPIALLPCASHISMKMCADCTMRPVVLFGLMTEVRDNTLIILENNSLADIAF
jgi:hypothetical protein